MLGSQATLPREIKGFKPHKGQVWIITIVLLALLGVGGWWSVQNGWLRRWLPAAEPVIVASGEIVIEQAQPAALAMDPAAQAASDQAAAAQATTAGADATAAVAAATPVAATTEPVAITGVAGVNGTALYDDAGSVVASLASGARLNIKASAADRTWLLVESAAGEGWAQAAEVIAYGLGRLDTVLLPATVVAASAPAAAPATADPAENAAVTATAVDPAGAAPATAPALALTAVVAGTGSNLNIRARSGTEHPIVAKAPDGSAYQAVGRTAAGDWLLLQAGDAPLGWAAAAYIELSGDLQTLPVVDVTVSA